MSCCLRAVSLATPPSTTSQLPPLESVPVIKSSHHTRVVTPMPSSLRRFLACVCRWDFEGSLMADDPAHPNHRCQVVTIDDLPDDVLLEIFDSHVAEVEYKSRFIGFGAEREIESWQTLVHVCQRWRGLVFASPRRLNLRLCCTHVTSARMSVDVWPALPLLIQGYGPVGDVPALLEHSDRIYQIQIMLDQYTTPQIEKLWRAMQVPFPELTALYLSARRLSAPVLPDSFLGGSAPRLRSLALTSIPFPGIPKLILSATHLVVLSLENIPHSGYISPEAIATCLSGLTSLETLQLGFESPQSCPDLESQPPFLPTRVVLPALTEFRFKGVNEYLEEFLAWIDAPQVYHLSITFFNDIHFDTPELIRFISCTPALRVYHEARLTFYSHEALLRLRPRPEPSGPRIVQVGILCQVSDWQLSSLAQICTSSLLPLLTMENLYVGSDEGPYSQLDWKDDIEAAEWLDLLHPFTTVKNLYLSKQFVPLVAPALQELTGGRTTRVLPALQNVFLKGFQPSEPVHEGIARFISARQLINRPVAISVWDRDLVLS